MSYKEEVYKLENLLVGFIQNRKIEIDKLFFMDNLINFSKENQTKVLNLGYLSLDDQVVLFDVMSNIRDITETMKKRLEIAHERHENPTTAESALELIGGFRNLIPFVEDFTNKRCISDLNKLSDCSRFLHRKAKGLGFSKDMKTKLKEFEISIDEVKSFVENLKSNIELELEMEDGLDHENIN